MTSLPPSLTTLIEEFAKLPGIGRKTAQRLAFYLLKRPSGEADALANAVLQAKRLIRACSVCFNYSETDRCEICLDTKRDQTKICAVEQSSDIFPFEKVGVYHGLYHVLGGALSPLDGVTPDDIRIKELLDRLDDTVMEVVIATNSSSAGEATALYLTKHLKPRNVKVTRIARGLPMGSELEFADEVTLYRAFEDRIAL